MRQQQVYRNTEARLAENVACVSFVDRQTATTLSVHANNKCVTAQYYTHLHIQLKVVLSTQSVVSQERNYFCRDLLGMAIIKAMFEYTSDGRN